MNSKVPNSKGSLPRLCESNSPECSGINPCAMCYAYVLVKVLPAPMRAAGFAKGEAQATAFFRTYAESWRRMLEAKIKEKSEGGVSPPSPSLSLLGYLSYQESMLKSVHNPSSPADAPASSVESIAPVHETNTNGTKPKTKLLRGDLKRIAEKEGKGSLAPASTQDDDAVTPGTRGDNH